jgi:ribosome-binding protein aMBF1 (putative translation factor)
MIGDMEGPRPRPQGRRSAFPGFADISERRRRLVAELVEARVQVGLSQTEVAAQMGTSQSAVARLEAGEADMRLSTLERYAAAVGRDVCWQLESRHEG